MAVKYTPRQDRPLDLVTEQIIVSSNNQSDHKKILLPGERIVSDLGSADGRRFQLTHTRVVLFRAGERSEHGTVYASARLTDISSVTISRRPRARRSAAWGIAGLFSAIGVWQVTTNSNVGIVAAIAVAIISLLLMADYWIRPSGIHVALHRFCPQASKTGYYRPETNSSPTFRSSGKVSLRCPPLNIPYLHR